MGVGGGGVVNKMAVAVLGEMSVEREDTIGCSTPNHWKQN